MPTAERAVAHAQQGVAGGARRLSPDEGGDPSGGARDGAGRPEPRDLLQPRPALLSHASGRARRSLLLRRGEPGAWAALTGDEGETELSFAFGPSDPAVYLLQHAAIADLREQRCDPLVVEENLAEAVARAVADARAFHGRRTTPRRRSTRRPIATSRTRRRSSLASSSASGSRWARSRPRSARRSTTSRGSSGPGPASRCTATGTSYGSEWRWSASPTRGRASPRSPTSSAT